MRTLLLWLMLLLCCTQSQARLFSHGATGTAAPPPFTLTGVSLTNSTFPQSGAASTVVGAVVVTSTGTPVGTTTISLTGTNAQGFRLDTTAYPGANVICPVAGCPSSAGPFTDVNLVATNTSAVGSPQSAGLSLTGTGSSTTTFNAGADCAASINITGSGLILTGTASSTTAMCRANVGKYSGKWYFTAHVNSAPSSPAYGVGGGAGVVGGFDPTSATNPATTPYAAMYEVGSSSGLIRWLNNTNGQGATTGGVSNGATIGVAVNLDTDSPQIWATPDITGTSGYAGGPLWNGSNTSSPEVPGSGTVVTSGTTGTQFFVPGVGVFPTFRSFGPDAATFSFATNATVESAIGAGKTVVYQPWNTSGGSAQSLAINVANAPAWVASTSYVAGDRVVAGPGWTSGSPGHYNQASALYLWALQGASGGTSGSSQPAGFSACASPAGVGGGLDGSIPSGWTGATTASDNGITWVCLTKVDYVTFTDAMLDDAPWASGKSYTYLSTVLSNGNWYGQGSFTACTSGGSAPSGTGGPISDGGCTSWFYLNPLTYSSQANKWPHQITFMPTTNWTETQFNYPVSIQVWHGGQARNVYQGGQAGEQDPIPFANHYDYVSDINPFCYKGVVWWLINSANTACAATNDTWRWDLKVASGDALNDNVNGTSGPLRTDPTKGVEFYSNSTFDGAKGVALGFSDSDGTVENLQFHSTNYMAIGSHGGGPGNAHTNGIIMTDSIVQSDAGPGGATVDGGWGFRNAVIIWNGSTAGGFGVASGYAVFFLNSTILGPGSGVTNGTCYAVNGYLGLAPQLKSTGCFGFANPYAFKATQTTFTADHNATDVSSGYSGGTTFSLADGTGTYTTAQLLGVGATCGPPGNTSSCYGLTIANQFVNPTVGGSLDLRIKNTSADIYGAGATGSFSSYNLTFTNGLDFFNLARPQSGRYDIGAHEHP